MRSLVLIFMLISGPALAAPVCEGVKAYGWKSKEEMTRIDMLNMELAKKGCAERKGGRNPCLKEFHKRTPESKFTTDYYAVCGQPKPELI